jgi:hypothetical protein
METRTLQQPQSIPRSLRPVSFNGTALLGFGFPLAVVLARSKNLPESTTSTGKTSQRYHGRANVRAIRLLEAITRRSIWPIRSVCPFACDLVFSLIIECRLEPPSPRFPDYRARPARDYSPQKSPTYPSIQGDTYRPYSSGQSYREPHVFVRSDSYRPQYDDSTRVSPRSVDKLNTDAYFPHQPSSHYDHDDTRSSTSIASTPPHHAVNSPPPDPPIIDRDARRHSPSCRRVSPAHSVARSRASSKSSEPPLKRSKSRSSSRSSASSQPDKSAISARSGLKDIVSPKPNRESTTQQAPTQILSRDPDRLGSTSTGKGSTHPEPLLHVGAKPVHPVMNGELNGPPLASNFPRSPPSLSSAEGTTVLFTCRQP